MIYSSPAASASDLWDDTLWEGFLRAEESGFQMKPWGSILFKVILSSLIKSWLRYNVESGNSIWTHSGNKAFEGKLFLLYRVHTNQGSTTQKHWTSSTSSHECYVQHCNAMLRWRFPCQLIHSHLRYFCSALYCIHISELVCQEARQMFYT